jgi:ketosteroid isomerase-like protein
MSTALPKLVADYFAAENRGDTEALLQCFIDHALVRDEGRTIEGAGAIKQWMLDAKKKYQHTAEPIETVERDGKTVVIAKVSGNFPNSPVNLEHIFGFEGDKIASLEIRS